MNSKGAHEVATSTRVYEDFVPSSKVVHEEEHSDTLQINLPGYKKEQLRVTLTGTGILKISGQRPVGTPNKWQRFQTEFAVAENCDRSKIRAKFENGILHVKQPKLITSSVEKDNELAAREADNSPAAKRQQTTLRDEFSKQDNVPAAKRQKTTLRDEFSKPDNSDISTPAKEEPKNNGPKVDDQTESKSLAEKKSSADESSSSSSSSSESESESTDDETTGHTSCLAAKQKKPKEVMIMSLAAALLVLGIGLYVANVMKSSQHN